MLGSSKAKRKVDSFSLKKINLTYATIDFHLNANPPLLARLKTGNAMQKVVNNLTIRGFVDNLNLALPKILTYIEPIFNPNNRTLFLLESDSRI